MGYPRKSYPHRCSPPCAKRARPRACARVYIIYRSPVGRSRGVFAPLWGRGRAVVAPCPAPPSAGWGRAKAKADAPSRSAPHFPRLRPRPCQLMGVAPCAMAEVHKAIPAPARAFSPRQPAYGRALARLCAESLCAKAEVHKTILAAARAFFPRQPAYGRITVCKGGVHKAKADAPSRSAPYFPRLRPSPCPPTAESLCAKAEVHKAIPAPARAFFPRQLIYGRASVR